MVQKQSKVRLINKGGKTHTQCFLNTNLTDIASTKNPENIELHFSRILTKC